VLNSYGKLATEWTVAGSFRVGVKFSTTKASTQTIIGKELYLKIDLTSAGALRVLVGNGSNWIINGPLDATGPYNDGKLYLAEVVYDHPTTRYALLVDGVEVAASVNSDTSDIRVEEVGAYNSSQAFFQGVIANVKLTDLGTPANSQAYDLDQATGTTESSTVNSGTLTYNNIPEANRFQAQLVGADWLGTTERNINGNFATSSDWTLSANATISGGLLNFGSGTVTATQEILTLGAVYKLEYDVDTFVGAEVGASSASFTSALYASGTGITEGIRTASSADFTLVSTTDGNKISSTSAKRILEAP
jgi:hypothetical protein